MLGILHWVWNTYTWPSLYICILYFRKAFCSSPNVKVSFIRYEKHGVPHFKSFYLQIKSLIYDSYDVIDTSYDYKKPGKKQESILK